MTLGTSSHAKKKSIVYESKNVHFPCKCIVFDCILVLTTKRDMIGQNLHICIIGL